MLGSLGLFGSATPLPALEHSNSITDAQNLALRVKRIAPGADGFNPVSHELESRANEKKKKKKGPSEDLERQTSYFSDSSLDGKKPLDKLKKKKKGPSEDLERQTSYFSDSSLDGKKPLNKLKKKQRKFKIGKPSLGKPLTMEDVGGERTYAEPGPPPPVPGSQGGEAELANANVPGNPPPNKKIETLTQPKNPKKISQIPKKVKETIYSESEYSQDERSDPFDLEP